VTVDQAGLVLPQAVRSELRLSLGDGLTARRVSALFLCHQTGQREKLAVASLVWELASLPWPRAHPHIRSYPVLKSCPAGAELRSSKK